ncbi:hypothetical protein R0K19_26695, partial [Bacillus sp. SIMBA_161]
AMFNAQQQMQQRQMAQRAALEGRQLGLAERRQGQRESEFEQTLPLQELRAKGYAAQAMRQGQQSVDPTKRPEYQRAQAMYE